jgi:hypothetical protein
MGETGSEIAVKLVEEGGVVRLVAALDPVGARRAAVEGDFEAGGRTVRDGVDSKG